MEIVRQTVEVIQRTIAKEKSESNSQQPSARCRLQIDSKNDSQRKI